MKVVTKLRLGSNSVIVFAVIFISVAFFLISGIQKSQREQWLAQKITGNSFQLILLQNEYLLRLSERPKVQWYAVYQALLTNLNEGKSVFVTPQEKLLFEDVRNSSFDTKKLFDQIVASVEGGQNKAFVEQIKDKLSIKAQERISNILVLSESSNKRSISMGYLLQFLMILLAGIITIISVWSYGVSHSISKSLRKISESTKIISGGNLDHKLEIKNEDEFGMLSALLNEMTTKLKELERLKDDFLSIATHELRSPLVPIRSQSELLLSGDYGSLSAKQKEAIEMIYRNEKVLNILTGEIFDITKIKSKKLKLVLGRINLGKVLTESVYDRKKMVEKKHLALSILFEPEIPEIIADEMRIRQVIVNLLDNAIKFTPENGTINIELKKTENEVLLKVKDSGIGLNKSNVEKIFVPFFQVETNDSRKYRGTGLGLAINKGIVEAHGGRIWVESDGEGKGSSFFVSLPIKE